ncbi:ABC transporter ATP-binding protein [Undibacterium amnicola]|uniref:ABC transporter ATP-binding protein n=1 Tax=Undibacterium amnicola TaxID=1834038 RepID=A0ABR6XQB5_9BURK|nr:ABC transporter ATP-binding protein [Undibacterium amnicola]MBC3831647.1 ABC transporter ATP-binding protein [Undibacterium amnicola]
MAHNNHLLIQQVCKSYSGDRQALDNIHLELGNGMFGLLGPNGAGKSSLMRSIATLQSIDSGKILFNGNDISKQPESIRRVLGYLPQEFGVYPKVSAEKLLHYLAVLKGIRDQQQRTRQIDYLLARTNLSQYRHQAVAEFSGGMRQRFGIAQALLADPQILIVDEPTAGLDPQECHSLHHLLCEIAQSMIIIFSTHIVEDIHNLCSNMAVLDHGKVRFSGAPKTLIERLSKQLWQADISPEQIPAFQQQFPLLSSRFISGRCQVRVLAAQAPSSDFIQAAPDLQDAYFYLLQQHQHASLDLQQTQVA